MCPAVFPPGWRQRLTRTSRTSDTIVLAKSGEKKKGLCCVAKRCTAGSNGKGEEREKRAGGEGGNISLSSHKSHGGPSPPPPLSLLRFTGREKRVYPYAGGGRDGDRFCLALLPLSSSGRAFYSREKGHLKGKNFCPAQQENGPIDEKHSRIPEFIATLQTKSLRATRTYFTPLRGRVILLRLCHHRQIEGHRSQIYRLFSSGQQLPAIPDADGAPGDDGALCYSLAAASLPLPTRTVAESRAHVWRRHGRARLPVGGAVAVQPGQTPLGSSQDLDVLFCVNVRDECEL